MSIATEIKRIKTAKENIINTLKSKNIQVNENAKISEIDVVIKEVPIIDTSDATATENDILEGKTAYVNNNKIQGILKAGGEGNAVIDINGLEFFSETSNTAYVLNRLMKKVPKINISLWSSTSYLFYNCKLLETIPELDTSNISLMQNMFYNCSVLKEIPQLNTSKVTNMMHMFYRCVSLTRIPQLDTSEVTNMNYTFQYCTALTEIPQLNTSKVVNMLATFSNCTALTKLPQLEGAKLTCVRDMFSGCKALTDFGGILNLGMAYTQKSNSYGNYTLDVGICNNLTYESLINILNNLYDLNISYDVANGGTLYRQKCILGTTNLAKLQATEEGLATLAEANRKGWDVS